jgi:protocatechuate 3,4-dioxygenase beta subunit
MHRLLLIPVLICALSGVFAADPAVRGRVVDPSGNPVPDARAYLLAPGDPAHPRDLSERLQQATARSRTDAEGYFSFPPAAAGVWQVRIEADGFLPRAGMLAPLLEDSWLPEVRLTKDRGANVLVQDPEGKPIAGALVQLTAATSRRMVGRRWWTHADREARTDAEGTVRLPRGPSESLQATVSHKDYGFKSTKVPAHGKTSIELGQQGLRALVVNDATGRAVSGATILRKGHPLGRTDDTGKTLVRLPDEAVSLVLVDKAGRNTERRFAPPTDETPQVWTLPEPKTLHGKLIDANSRRPIAGAVVWPEDRLDTAVTTDAGGTFSWSAYSSGKVPLTAGATGYLPPDPMRLAEADYKRGASIALKPAATIIGRVLDEQGQGIAGAELRRSIKPTPGRFEFRFGGRPQRTQTISDQQGRFRITGVDPDRIWIVNVESEGYAPGTFEANGLEPYTTKSGFVVTLERGGSLRGQVVDEERLPIPGVEVSASRASGGGGRMARMMGRSQARIDRNAITDKEGMFQVDNLPAGKFDLAAKARGYAPRKLPGVELKLDAATEPVEIMLAPGERMQGMVLGALDKPLEGAKVFVAPEGGAMRMFGMGGGDNMEPDAVVGADGWFYLYDLAEGVPATIRVEHPGHVTETVDRIRLPQTDVLVIELAPSSTVRGLVRDDEGNPQPGANVTLARSTSMSLGGNRMMMMMNEDTTTDAEGRFEFTEVRPGSLDFTAVASGFKETSRNSVELPAGEDIDDLILDLTRGATVEGVVSLPDGRPAIGARVDRVREGGGPMMGMGGTATDGSGHYRLEGLEPGVLSIEATHDEYPRTVRDIELKTGENNLNLAFEGGFRVSGTVRGEDGSPIAGARIDLSSRGRIFGGFGADSGASGEFSVEGVPDGTYNVRVSANGYAASDPNLEINVAGQPVEGLEVTLPKGGRLLGSVEGVREEDYPRISIRAVHRENGDFRSASVDYEGRFEIENAANGRWELTGTIRESGRRAETETTLEVGALEGNVVLVFGGGVKISGRAHLDETPVRDATVALEGMDITGNAWTRTDNDGRFQIEGIDPGNYRLTLRQWDTGLTYTEEVDLTTNQDLDLDIPTATVEGLVRDSSDNAALEGVSISMEPADGSSGRVFGGYGASTDADGRYLMRNVTDGTWTMTARMQGYAVLTRTVNVQNGRAPSNLDFRLDPTEGLVLRVSLPNGAPADRALLVVQDNAGTVVAQGSYDSGENGRIRLASIPAGSWRVLAQSGSSAVSSFGVQAPSPETPVMLVPKTRHSQRCVLQVPTACRFKAFPGSARHGTVSRCVVDERRFPRFLQAPGKFR